MRLSLMLQLGLCYCSTKWGATLRAFVVEDHSGHALISAELQIAKPSVAELVANLESDSSGKLGGTVPVDGQTDANGEYRIFGLKPGKYRIAAA
jgi:hypothetical protein